MNKMNDELEKEIERLHEILVKWEICDICGLDYGGYTDEPCKCNERVNKND